MPLNNKNDHTASSSIEGHNNWTIADLIVRFLKNLGVDYLFGVPGGGIDPLYYALARSEANGELRAIVARHETGAAFMADGYARESGKLGVCCSTTGPGATNLITGVASAHENETPLLVITAQTAISTFGKGAFQESSCTGVNIVGMFQHCTRYNSLVSHPAQLEQKLVAAIMSAFQAPCGPAHLSIPIDVMSAPAPQPSVTLDMHTLLLSNRAMHHPAPELLNQLLHRVVKAKKIVMVLGAGCGYAIDKVLKLAYQLNAPIITLLDGRGMVSSFHPQFRGVFGFAGHKSAMETLRASDVDLVLALGTKLSEFPTGGWDQRSLLNKRMIHIDSVTSHFVYSTMAQLQVSGAIDETCQFLIDQLPSDEKINNRVNHLSTEGTPAHFGVLPNCTLDEPDKYNDNSIPIKPQRLMRELGRLFPPSTRFLADIGNSFVWATHYLHPLDRRMLSPSSGHRSDEPPQERRQSKAPLTDNKSYLAGTEFASMGWAIGASVGVALASPGRPVVCITGDGSMLMSGQEITVAVKEELCIFFVLLNDSSLGMVKHGQRLGGSEPVACQLPSVDFAMLARSMGVKAHSIRSADDLQALDIKALCSRKAPVLLDVYIDPDESPPMGVRVNALAEMR